MNAFWYWNPDTEYSLPIAMDLYNTLIREDHSTENTEFW